MVHGDHALVHQPHPATMRPTSVLPRQREHIYRSLALRHALVAGIAAEKRRHAGFFARFNCLDVEFGLTGVGGHKLKQTIGMCHLQLVFVRQIMQVVVELLLLLLVHLLTLFIRLELD